VTAAVQGALTVIFIMLTAGLVAYVGDRVGHQVGRRRLTLFNLRPKHTSTLVAIATGMVIALFVIGIASAASVYVRRALFEIVDLNKTIADLQTRAASLQREVDNTRSQPRIIPFGEPIWNEFLILQPSQSPEQRYDALRSFFDETVKAANTTWARTGLRPYPETSADADIQKKLHAQVDQFGPLLGRSPVLILPIASQNLFRGDVIGFQFAAYPDEKVAATHSTLGTLSVEGGKPIDFPALIAQARDTVISRGMPPAFVTFPLVNGPQAQAIAQQVAHSRGRFEVVAQSAQDTYPHTRALIIDFAVRARK
jgi:hypothetical protein